MNMVRDEYPDHPLFLEGALGKRRHYQQFQPVITLAKGYTIHWDHAAPAEVTIWLINFSRSVNSSSAPLALVLNTSGVSGCFSLGILKPPCLQTEPRDMFKLTCG